MAHDERHEADKERKTVIVITMNQIYWRLLTIVDNCSETRNGSWDGDGDGDEGLAKMGLASTRRIFVLTRGDKSHRRLKSTTLVSCRVIVQIGVRFAMKRVFRETRRSMIMEVNSLCQKQTIRVTKESRCRLNYYYYYYYYHYYADDDA
jgi:hypothetical protein